MTLRSHSLIRHTEQQQPNGDTFQCNLCRIALYSIAATRIHMEEMHAQLQSIYCGKDKCLQILANSDELEIHWITKHSA